MKSIKELKEERSALHEKMHEIVQTAEQRSDTAFTAEEQAQYNEYRTQYDALSERIARLEADEQRAAELARPVSTALGKGADTEETRAEKRNEELRAAFLDVLSGRKTRNDLTQEVRDGLFLGASNNQIVVPKLVMSKVTMALKSTGTFLNAVDFVITQTSDSYVLPTYDATGDELVRVKEGSKTSDDSSNKFGGTEIKAYDYNTKIQKIHVNLLKTSGVDVEAVVVEAIAQCIRRGLNKLATISGTGTDDITALLSSAPTGVTTASKDAVTYDELVDMVASVDGAYADSWIMSRNTLLNIAKIKTTDGSPIFLKDVNTGAITHILGHPVVINNDMPQIGTAEAKVIAFGDPKAYHLRMVDGVRMTVFYEKYADENMIGIMGHILADGKLNDAGTHPIKVLALASA
ncbi:phage major capsid protein [Alistipes onderdonkii]|jgi:HK97 family phage major capsid protein|uniref:phage major capsid protein n=1 Tax=Alistipes onderdonkii TaxID=328813 RepID=UPI00050A3463|nr:phage major capsid protein [Alistipes onderdonkii]